MAYTGTSPGTTGSLAMLYAKDYDEIFFDNYTERAPEYTRIAKVQNCDQHSWKEGVMTTFGDHLAMGEGGAPSYDVLTTGGNKEVTFVEYGLGYTMTRTMAEDDKTGYLRRIPAELGKSARHTIESLYFDIFNSGFVTTNRTGLDGLALFSASHTMINGDTQSNLGSGALSETTLQAALNHFETIKNDNDRLVSGFEPKLLLIPYNLKWKAKTLLKSEFKPLSMDNDINTLYDEGLQYMVIHEWTSTTAWAVLAPQHDLRLIWRRNVAFDSADDFNTKSALFDSTFRLAVEFFDWRGVYGSPGT